MDSYIHRIKKITLDEIGFQGDIENPSIYTRKITIASEDTTFEFNLFAKKKEELEIGITEVKKI